MEKPWVYLDTSAFLKLYIKEKGSARVRKIAQENHVLSSSMLRVESFSALARRRQAGDIEESDLNHVLKRLKEGIRSVETVSMTEDVLDLAGEITLRSLARTLDAVHIASARLFQDGTGIVTTFVTSDRKQHDAAVGEGLKSVHIG